MAKRISKLGNEYEQPDRVPKPDDFEPEATFPEGHRWAGLPRCLNWAYRQGRQCLNTSMIGRTKCRKHGGKVPRGVAHHSFTTGTYSKSLPEGLAASYEQSRTNNDLVSLKEEIALVEMRIKELFGTMKTDGDTTKTWARLKLSLYRYQTTNQPTMKAAYLDEIIKGIEIGATQNDIWGDVFTSMSMRRRLVDTEYKRLIQYGHMLNVEQLMTVIGRLLSIIKTYVDRDQFAQIAGELRKLVLSRTGEESDPRRLGTYLPKPSDAREVGIDG